MRNISYRMTAAGLALGLLAPMAAADARKDKTVWGAAAVAAGVGAVVEASKDRPMNAAILAAGAALAYRQYDKASDAARDERFSPYPISREPYNDRDPYGYDRYDSRSPGPRVRPGARSEPYYDYGVGGAYGRRNIRYDRNTREVIGIVTSASNPLSRDIKVRLENGQIRTIDVPRNIVVRRGGDDISVHRLDRDEVVRIRIERYTADGDLRARRVDVLGRSDRDEWFDRDERDDRDNRDTRIWGRVSSIDSRSNILRLDADGRRFIVYTDRADILDGGRRRALRDLDNGDRVIVEGRRDGDRLYATRVTID